MNSASIQSLHGSLSGAGVVVFHKAIVEALSLNTNTN
jgi:hypothetical protein